VDEIAYAWAVGGDLAQIDVDIGVIEMDKVTRRGGEGARGRGEEEGKRRKGERKYLDCIIYIDMHDDVDEIDDNVLSSVTVMKILYQLHPEEEAMLTRHHTEKLSTANIHAAV